MKLIELNLQRIIDLCRKHKVKTLAVFGSIFTDRFNDQSDVDFSVLFKKGEIKLLEYADNFFDFIDELKVLLGRDIDMVCEDAVKNPYFRKELDATKRLIYG